MSNKRRRKIHKSGARLLQPQITQVPDKSLQAKDKPNNELTQGHSVPVAGHDFSSISVLAGMPGTSGSVTQASAQRKAVNKIGDVQAQSKDGNNKKIYGNRVRFLSDHVKICTDENDMHNEAVACSGRQRFNIPKSEVDGGGTLSPCANDPKRVPWFLNVSQSTTPTFEGPCDPTLASADKSKAQKETS